MSTILNALKKAKTEREKNAGQGGTAPGRSTGLSTNAGQRGSSAPRSEAAAAGNSAAPPLSPPRMHYTPYQPAPARPARSPGLVILLVVVLGGLLGGATYLLTRNSGNRPPQNGNPPQIASMAASPGALALADEDTNDSADDESNSSNESADGLAASAVSTRIDRGVGEKPEPAGSVVSGDLPGKSEIAMGGKPLVRLGPPPEQPPPDNGSGTTPPPAGIDPAAVQAYINYLDEPVDARMKRSASRLADLPPEVDAKGESKRRRRPDRELAQPDPQTAPADVHTTGPMATPTPRPTPETTPTIPPSPTLYPAGSKVMDSDIGWKVEGILWSETAPSAIINDRVVREGDIVNKVKILKINRDDVTAEHLGREITVRF